MNDGLEGKIDKGLNRFAARIRLLGMATACCLGVALLSPGPASAQVGGTSVLTVDGQVTAIDQATRMVTVKMSDGTEETARVGPEVRNLAQIQVGDIMTIDFSHTVLLELRAPEDLSVQERSGVNRAPTGAAPKAVGAEQLTITAKIIAIDYKTNSVTFEGPEGGQKTYQVKDPTLRAKLATLKPGQVIRATVTDVVAVSVKHKS